MMAGPAPELYGAAAGLALRAADGDPAGAPDARTMLGLLGVRGTGKTAVLDSLAETFAARGAAVHRSVADAARARATVGGSGSARATLLVDDAHTLGDDDLRCLLDLARDAAGPHLVVAARPPIDHSEALAVARHLERVGPVVVLDRIRAPDALEWARSALGRDLEPEQVDRLLEQTDGAPWLVERVLAACSETLELDGDPPEGLMHRLALDLERLDADVAALALALGVGFDLRSRMLPSWSPFQSSDLDRVVKAARADGILRADDGLIPLIGAAAVRAAPAHRVGAMQLELAGEFSKRGRPLDPALADPSAAGLLDPGVASALALEGDAHLLADPARANDYYSAALAAGAERREVRARQAQAALAVGDTETAGHLIEQHVVDGEPRDLGRTVDVAAAHWAARCLPGRSAEIYRWYGAERVGASAPSAAIALYGAGDPETGKRMLEVTSESFPTGVSISARNCGRALRASLGDDPSPALALLVRASSTLTVTGVMSPLPEHPAALAAIVAMHSGDLGAAVSVLDDAIDGDQGGAGALPRFLLLRAWASMLAGEPARARDDCARARRHPYPLAPRDELFARSLEVGLARRADDLQALMRAWRGVREFVMTVGMGLFTLLPLGELVVAAARMSDSKAVEPALREAWALLERLGDPPLWSSTLRWSCVHAGIIANRPDDLTPHAAALVRAARHFPLAAALAQAGRTWVRMLGGHAD
ncbi:MAG: hypothetical protein ACTH31_08010, partial [Pseudoclavibacter sp.]